MQTSNGSLKQFSSLGSSRWLGGFPGLDTSSVPDICCSLVGSSVGTPLLFVLLYYKATVEKTMGRVSVVQCFKAAEQICLAYAWHLITFCVFILKLIEANHCFSKALLFVRNKIWNSRNHNQDIIKEDELNCSFCSFSYRSCSCDRWPDHPALLTGKKWP